MTFNRRSKPVELDDAPVRRYLKQVGGQVELREGGDENSLRLTGYASTFMEYEMFGGPANGGWIERIHPDAFNVTLRDKPDLHLLVNHEGWSLARTKSGTLRLSVDGHGLRVEADLDRSDPDVQRLEPKMRRKDMDEMSFAFRVKAQTWEATADFPDDDMALRTITELSLHKGDVSVVNFGANPTTSASVRSVEEALKIIAECGADELAEARGEGDILRQAQEKLGVNAQVVIQNLHTGELRSGEGLELTEMISIPAEEYDTERWLQAERGWQIDVREWLYAEREAVIRAWLDAETEFNAVRAWLDAEQENTPKRGMSLRLAKALAGE